MDAAFAEERLDLGEVTLNVVSAGPPSGELVVLLHGFPEHGRAWWRQITALADAGYRVLAPDQRGYATSSKPAGIEAYHLDALAGDVAALIEATGRDDAHVVGHDWGGGVAWWTAIRHASKVRTLGILNMPHPQVLVRRHMRYHLHRCWYFYVLALPSFPEWLLSRDDFDAVAQAFASAEGAISDDEIEAARRGWREPGALTGMINWYRALVRLPLDVSDTRVRLPTTIIWGVNDQFISPVMAEASREACDDARLERLEASHWVQHEHPERVTALLLEGFSRRPAA